MSSHYLSSKSTVSTLTDRVSAGQLLDKCDPSMLINILEAVYDFVTIFDDELVLLDCSKSFLEYFNANYDMMVGKNLRYIIPEFEKKDLYSEFKLSCDRIGYYEHDNFALDDPNLYKQPIYVRFKMYPMNSLIICTAEDITVRIQYDILKQKYSQLLVKNEHLELLLSTSENNHLQIKDCETNLEEILQKQKNFTIRETEVSMLIIQGKSTKEIAEALFISSKAINFHRSNIRKKLGLINSKTSLKAALLDL